VKLRINGETREVPRHVGTVAALSAWLDLPGYGSAIELNGEVIRRAEQPSTRLNEGDQLEVVRLVGGG
jgi:sulfur carrier protein